MVAEANQIQDDFELTISSLPDYLENAPDADLPGWQGELRSGARANLLMGVGSNRVDVKQAAARAERSLEQLAEPLSALFLPPEQWPAPFLDLAWLLMIRNSAHDSICACSVDDVVDAVLHRYAEARHIGEGLTDAAVAALAASMAEAGPLVVNPSATARRGLVEVVVTADGPPGPDVQVLSERFGLPGSITLDGETVRNMLGLIQGARIDNDTYITDVTLAEDDTGLDITIVIGTEPRPGVAVEEVKRELYTRLTARPDTEVRLILDQPPVRRILARQELVPGFGWAPFAPTPLDHPARVESADDGRRGPEQRPGHRGCRPGRRNLLRRRRPGIRTAGRQRRPRRHLQLLAADRRHRRRRARRRWRWPPVNPGRSGRPPSSPPPTPGLTGWTSRTKTRVGSNTVVVETTLELRADEPVWSGCTPSSTTPRGTTGCGCTSPCPNRRRPHRPSAPSPSSNGD